jgi:hypothetical protein
MLHTSAVIPEPSLRAMVMLLATSLALYTRSIFIPSSARRTLVVSALAAAPVGKVLETWVLACLEKDPSRRPRSAAAAAAVLGSSPDDEWSMEAARERWRERGRRLVESARRGSPSSAATLSMPVVLGGRG